MDITSHIKEGRLRIMARPNAPKTEIISWDKEKQALKIAINAPPDKDKANNELIKFLSKLLKKKVEITSGQKSRLKTVKII